MASPKTSIEKVFKAIDKLAHDFSNVNFVKYGRLKNKFLKLPDYERAYCILMEYWDSISDEEKPRVDKELKRCGL